MKIGPTELGLMTLAEIRDWIMAWNDAHASGPSLSDDERQALADVLDAVPQILMG